MRALQCDRAPGSTGDTVLRQWLVEVAPDGAVASAEIGSRLDSSFDDRFTGAVTVAKSALVPALPVWEVCGPYVSGDLQNGERSDRACRQVVSPVATRAVQQGAAIHRTFVFVPAGLHAFLERGLMFGTASTWTADADGWVLTETWQWRTEAGAPALDAAGKPREPLVERTRYRWEPGAVGFLVTPLDECSNYERAHAALDSEGSAAVKCGR